MLLSLLLYVIIILLLYNYSNLIIVIVESRASKYKRLTFNLTFILFSNNINANAIISKYLILLYIYYLIFIYSYYNIAIASYILS